MTVPWSNPMYAAAPLGTQAWASPRRAQQPAFGIFIQQLLQQLFGVPVRRSHPQASGMPQFTPDVARLRRQAPQAQHSVHVPVTRLRPQPQYTVPTPRTWTPEAMEPFIVTPRPRKSIPHPRPWEAPITAEGAPSLRAKAFVEWAMGEQKKGINERDHQRYITGDYSQGQVRPWCMDFLSTGLQRTGGSPWGHISSVAGLRDWSRKNGVFYDRGSAYQPKVGDIAVWKDRGKSHVGAIIRIENGKIITVEGNTSDKVGSREYAISNPTGYVDMDAAFRVAGMDPGARTG